MPAKKSLVGSLGRLLLFLGAASLEAQVESLPGLDFGSLAPREVRIYLPPGGVKSTTSVLIALTAR